MNLLPIVLLYVVSHIGFIIAYMAKKDESKMLGLVMMLIVSIVFLLIIVASNEKVEQLELYKDGCPVYERIEEPMYRLESQEVER